MNHKNRLSLGFCIWIAIMILTLPLQWLAAAACAAAVHEGCHCLAIRLCGGKAAVGELRAWNAGIPLPYMGRFRELLCALAGPMGGLLLLFLLPFWPAVAYCGCAQSLYNLLPIYPLDGGRALFCANAILFPPQYANCISHWIQWICTGALLAMGFYLTWVQGLGAFPMLVAAIAAMKANSTCKQNHLALQ